MSCQKLEKLSSSRCHFGRVEKYQHFSESCQSTMKFSIFIPDNDANEKLPGLYFLSGLTCNEDNFITKAGAVSFASQKGLFLICPDTSPRGCNIEGEDDAFNLGTGAGFYLDATEPKWAKHYNMYTYIVEELPSIIYENFLVDSKRVSIFGHSMGGHGALTIGLKNSGKFKSCSAFAPVCNPINGSWGKNAFTHYLGTDEKTWKKYDATELIKEAGGISPIPILIDQGSEDEFLKDGHLLPNNLLDAVKVDNSGQSVLYSLQVGYDHSYWFIQTFIENHIDFHVKYLFE